MKLDLEALTGRDFKEAKRLFEHPGKWTSGFLATDAEFASFLVARAAKVPVELLDYVSAADYAFLTQQAINFLLTQGYAPQEVQQILDAKAEVEAQETK